jgi:VLRF1 release factor-like protein
VPDASASPRVVEVAPERLARWLAGFAERHGGVTTAEVTPQRVLLVGADGARADVEVPFPPLPGGSLDDLVAHVLRERVVGVLLVRLGGHAAGVFEGDRLLASKVGSRLVHSRHRAGGWSQQRFARRREQQSAAASAAATEVAARVLPPYADRLDGLVLGGDRRAVDKVLADRRLAALMPLVVPRFLHVPDPRLDVLRSTPRLFRAVHVRVSGGGP